MSTALVTGCNRGIGLELCRQLAARGDEVVATCRKSSPELEALGVRTLSGIDMTDDASIASLARELEGTQIDLLVNNAGAMTREGIEELDVEKVRSLFEINALGPLRVARALLPNMQRGSKLAMMTSLMGSMTDNGSGGYYAYRMSKAALNAASVSLARDLESEGIAVIVLHPGMVATDMTDGRGITVARSVEGMLERIDALTPATTGTFWHSDGRELPW